MPQMSGKMDSDELEGLRRNSLSNQAAESKVRDGEATGATASRSQMETLQNQARLDRLEKKMIVHQKKFEIGASKAQELLEKERKLEEKEKELNERAEGLNIREGTLAAAEETIVQMEEELEARRGKERDLHKTLTDFDLDWVRSLVEEKST